MVITENVSSCEVMNKARSIRNVEPPREEGNTVLGVSDVAVVHEPELAAHRRRRRQALHLLALRVRVPRVVVVAVHLRRLHHSARGRRRRGGGGARSPLLFLESYPTGIA